MPVSKDFLAFVLEQLAKLPQVSTRRMFGAVGLYSGTDFFAVIDDDVLYLKVDDSTRNNYVARGCKPFCPFPDSPTSMNYYDLPADVLEDAEELQRWARQSVDVAARSAATKAARRKTKPKPKLKSKSKSGDEGARPAKRLTRKSPSASARLKARAKK